MGLLAGVQSVAAKQPPRVFLYAREKFGKSSLGAYAPKPIFFMTRGETGLVELISSGRVPPTPHFPYDANKPPTWGTLTQGIKELTYEPHDFRTFFIDTANGAEILCQEHIRNSQFGGRQDKFAAYGKGWDACKVAWGDLLASLDLLRSTRHMAIVFLAHTQIKKFDDPTTAEQYDKYRPACQEKLWELTHKWADCICFGQFLASLYETESGKTKARQEMERAICFQESPAWEAGNRYGIQGTISVSNGAKEAWASFAKVFDGRFDLPSPSDVIEAKGKKIDAAASIDELKDLFLKLSDAEKKALNDRKNARKAVLDAAIASAESSKPTTTEPTGLQKLIREARANLADVEHAIDFARLVAALDADLATYDPGHKSGDLATIARRAAVVKDRTDLAGLSDKQLATAMNAVRNHLDMIGSDLFGGAGNDGAAKPADALKH